MYFFFSKFSKASKEESSPGKSCMVKQLFVHYIFSFSLIFNGKMFKFISNLITDQL